MSLTLKKTRAVLQAETLASSLSWGWGCNSLEQGVSLFHRYHMYKSSEDSIFSSTQTQLPTYPNSKSKFFLIRPQRLVQSSGQD